MRPASLGAKLAVRTYTPDDVRFVAELSDRSFAEYGARPSRYTLSVIQRPTTRTWLAVEADIPVGMIVLERAGSTAAILAIAVSELARGRGVGDSLMHTAEQYARSRRVERLTLCTADSNLAALDLFLRRGFRIVRRNLDFYSRGQDACELVKALTPRP